MEIVEILAGGNFAKALTALGLSGKCTYKYSPPKEVYREKYQVWELSKDDFESLCNVDDERWSDDWGWWRFSTGSNMGVINHEFIVHGNKLMAWNGSDRDDFGKKCLKCSDYYLNCQCQGFRKPTDVCYAYDEDKEICYRGREYPDLLTYFCEEIGASTEKNVCALATDLAKQNNMKLSELFKKYLG